MDSEEIDVLIGELDKRVERLKAMYEQYFLGIEKVEPTILRKEVDRRFWTLRKAQVRNTAQRFRLNMISQRYNTYQQYWRRIMRQIEAGTYKRHLQKASKRFGESAEEILKAGEVNESELARQEREEKARRALEQVPDLESFEIDVDFDLEELAREAAASIPDAPAHPAPRRSRSTGRRPAPMNFDLDEAFEEDEDDITQPNQIPAFLREEQPPTSPGIGATKHEPPSPPPAPPRPAAAPRPGRPSAPRVPSRPSRRPPPPDQVRARLPVPPVEPGKSPMAPPVRRSSALERSRGSKGAERPQRPRPAPPIPSPGPVQHKERPQPAPSRSMSRTARSASKPETSPVASERRQAPPTRREPSGGGVTGARTTRERAGLSGTARRGQRPQRQVAGLSEQRIREIYEKYVTARRQCNESTSSITERSLAETLKKSAEKLRRKHAGGDVDFDVVIHKGKAVIKPKIKKK